jgi:hypothetical protein
LSKVYQPRDVPIAKEVRYSTAIERGLAMTSSNMSMLYLPSIQPTTR